MVYNELPINSVLKIMNSISDAGVSQKARQKSEDMNKELDEMHSQDKMVDSC